MHGDGAKTSNDVWLPTASQIAKHNYRFISLSMPGYGKSSGNQADFRANGVEVLREVLDLLKLDKAIILGRSVGGRTAIEFVNIYP